MADDVYEDPEPKAEPEPTEQSTHFLYFLVFIFFEKEVHSHRKCMSISMVFEIGSLYVSDLSTFAQRRLMCHNVPYLENSP